MKRMISVACSVLLLLALLAGCGSKTPESTGNVPTNTENTDTNVEKLSVVSTIFPGYDFVRAVAGEHVDLKMLLPPGSESHSFEPTPQDIIAISECDVFIYVGGDSDAWVDGILDSIDTSNMKIVSMMDLVDTVQEEIVEGMEYDHDHSHEEFDPEHVFDCPFTDWEGTWKSIESTLESGNLDAYFEHAAEEKESDAETQKNAYAARWKSDYPEIKISGDTGTFGGETVTYEYTGYQIVETESSAGVWYGFAAIGETDKAPKYIAFSDHGTGADPHAEEHEEEHEAHAEEQPHFHLRYGNDSVEALIAMEDWAPTYFLSKASNEEIADAMLSHNHAHDEEYDEHVWTSPKNAMRITEAIADILTAKDKANAEAYQKSAEAYIAQLEALDESFREVVAGAARKTLVFGDRFPFRYFADEYGLEYYAAFSGCSTETEASAQTVAFLIDKTEAEKIPVVFQIEFSNGKIADTIAETTGAKKLMMHSCHNVSKTEFESGVTYLELMQQNVTTLKEALS